jgi:hypothetical protein
MEHDTSHPNLLTRLVDGLVRGQVGQVALLAAQVLRRHLRGDQNELLGQRHPAECQARCQRAS